MDANFSHHPKYLPISIALQRAHGLDIVTDSCYRHAISPVHSDYIGHRFDKNQSQKQP
ncbi:hypothetical protein KEM48_011392 [Puccinia striiformis f. sp. tritici PST-130]|nr:hypothetical protein KEM48_011392 [Puccinia striiformis f. sp. tritici PST-130]